MAKDEATTHGPCERLDIQLEMGAVVGQPSRMGKPVSMNEADDCHKPTI